MSDFKIGIPLLRYITIELDRVTSAQKWFDWHNDALMRVANLRSPAISNAQRVRIAILDSGIQLSEDDKDIYDIEPGIRYQDWVDQGTEWNDNSGHGTHLAILLRKIAPNAIIHVGRVFKKQPTKKSGGTIAKVRIPELN